jgi:uncharacterized protein (DUF58 family)
VAARPEIDSDTLRQFERLAFVSRRPARGGTGGEHVSRRPAPSTDFIDYRPYHPGDDFRRVDWNVYGRLGSLQVKVTQGRERLAVLLVLDCSGSMDYGQPDKLGVATHLVLALASIGASRVDTVRIAYLGQPNPPARPFARRGIPDLVRQLSQLSPTGLVDLNTELDICVPSDSRAGTLAVVISDLLSPDGAASGLDSLRARLGDVAVVHIVSPQELDPSVSGEVELIDAESGRALELGVSLDTLAAYRTRFNAWLDARADECLRRGLRYIRVRTDRPLASIVLDDLRRGGLLK